MKSTCLCCLHRLQKAYVAHFIRRISTTHMKCSDTVQTSNRKNEVAKLSNQNEFAMTDYKRPNVNLNLGVVSLVDQQILTDKNRLVEYLRSNIIYEDELITAVSKLSGTSVFGDYQDYQRSILTHSVSGQEVSDKGDQRSVLSIANVLPELRELLNCGQLDIALGNPRYHSGVVIFSKTDEAKKRIKKCVTTAQSQKQTHLKYLVVTSGIPDRLQSGQEVMSFVRKKFGDRVMTVRTEKSRRVARQEGEEILTVFDVRPLAVNPRVDTALLQVNVNKAKWDGVETYLTEKLCSALGDHLYSCRVGSVLGVAMRVEPHLASPATQVLQPPLKKKLRIHKDDLHLLPLHVHRNAVELPNFPDKGSGNLHLSASLPEYFQATLHKLGLTA